MKSPLAIGNQNPGLPWEPCLLADDPRWKTMSNREIAAVTGFGHVAVANHRKRLGFPKYKRQGDRLEADKARLAAGRKHGSIPVMGRDDPRWKTLSNKAIGAVFGLGDRTIGRQRRSLGLPRFVDVDRLKTQLKQGVQTRRVTGVSAETRERISKARLGWTLDASVREKISATNRALAVNARQALFVSVTASMDVSEPPPRT